MKRTILLLFACLVCASLGSCEDKHQTPPGTGPGKEDPPTPPKPIDGKKEKMLWMDADDNFMTNFSTPEKITALLDKIKDTGFNKIVVDVRPCEGSVLYDSDFMPAYANADSRGYDYLQFVIDEAKKRGIKVTASAVIFGAGFMKDAYRDPTLMRTRGVAWDDRKLRDLACMEYVAGKGIVSTMDETQAAKKSRDKAGGGFIFLNPAHPEVQDYVLRFVEEIATKYDFDAFALDYCRFPDSESDFSDFSKGEFEKFIGKKIAKWPDEIFTYAPDGKSHVKGQYYYEWWRWRAAIIHDVIGRIRAKIKEIKPDVRLEYWAGSWLSKDSGQNWASPSYNLSADPDAGWHYRDWMTAEYSLTGFADQLDTFLCGTYMADTYEGPTGPNGYADPDPNNPPMESMEYQLQRAGRYIGKACTFYGNVTAASQQPSILEEQIYYCLKHSAGVMVFDVSYFVNNEAKWAAFKRGIERAEKELAAEGK